MLGVDRAWQRQAHRFPGKKPGDFRFIAIGQNFTLASTVVSGLTRIDFAAGTIILGITACATITGSAMTQAMRDWKQAFSCQIDFPNSVAMTTGSRLIAGALFGSGERCDFPGKEIYIENNGSLNYTVENLTTSTLVVSIIHHCITPGTVQ
jgi:hypothetical protein